jgi:hypothetical protein
MLETPKLFSKDKRVFRTTNKEHLEIAKAYGAMPPGYRDINVAIHTGDRTGNTNPLPQGFDDYSK